MQLAELSPIWLERDGQRVGITFLCPHCKTQRLVCIFYPMGMREQCKTLNALGFYDFVPAKESAPWSSTSGDSFDNLSITPSVDASASGHWHGWIEGGKIA